MCTCALEDDDDDGDGCGGDNTCDESAMDISFTVYSSGYMTDSVISRSYGG